MEGSMCTALEHLLQPAKRGRLVEFEAKISEFLERFKSILSDERVAIWKAERARIRRELKEKPKKEKKEKTHGSEPWKTSQSKRAARGARVRVNVVQQPRK